MESGDVMDYAQPKPCPVCASVPIVLLGGLGCRRRSWVDCSCGIRGPEAISVPIEFPLNEFVYEAALRAEATRQWNAMDAHRLHRGSKSDLVGVVLRLRHWGKSQETYTPV